MPETELQPKPPIPPVVILTGSVAMLFISGGGMFLIAVALKDVSAEFGWPREIPSLAFSLQFIGSGIGGIVMGYVLDRFGFGVPAFIGAVMVGLGGLLTSQIDAAWQLLTIYAVMFGLSGQGSLAAPALANIARWYEHRRGMAIGIVSSGQALAGIVWPPVFGWALTMMGWRDMFFWFGVFSISVMLPLAWLVRHRPPAYVAPPIPENPSRPSPSMQKEIESIPGLSNKVIQVMLTIAILGCCLAMAMPLGHIVAYVNDIGYPIIEAVTVLSVMLFSAFVSRAVVLGLITDRIGGLWSLLVFSAIQAAMLGVFTLVTDLWALYAVAILFGLGYGGIFPVYAVAVRDHLPPAETGRRTGIIFFSGAVAMGIGGWLGGYLFDVTGSYTSPFLIGVAGNVCNLVLIVWLISRIRPMTQRRISRAAASG